MSSQLNWGEFSIHWNVLFSNRSALISQCFYFRSSFKLSEFYLCDSFNDETTHWFCVCYVYVGYRHHTQDQVAEFDEDARSAMLKTNGPCVLPCHHSIILLLVCWFFAYFDSSTWWMIDFLPWFSFDCSCVRVHMYFFFFFSLACLWYSHYLLAC